jgi:hypothetical protein
VSWRRLGQSSTRSRRRASSAKIRRRPRDAKGSS